MPSQKLPQSRAKLRVTRSPNQRPPLSLLSLLRFFLLLDRSHSHRAPLIFFFISLSPSHLFFFFGCFVSARRRKNNLNFVFVKITLKLIALLQYFLSFFGSLPQKGTLPLTLKLCSLFILARDETGTGRLGVAQPKHYAAPKRTPSR